MISSRQEPDDAASPPLSLEEFDHGTNRPRLRRIARKVTDSGAELPAAKTVPERKRNETTNRPASIEESSKRGLKRVAPKSDSNAERRRKKLARIREELIQQRLTGDSVLASRVTAAIRNSALPVPRENKRKKSRKGVGWVLDSKAVAAALDSRVAAGSSSGFKQQFRRPGRVSRCATGGNRTSKNSGSFDRQLSARCQSFDSGFADISAAVLYTARCR